MTKTTRKVTSRKAAKPTRVKRETTRHRPETTNREARIKMLVRAGFGNQAIWAAMEEEYPKIIPPKDERRTNTKNPHYVKNCPAYDADERGKVSRAINSTRALAIKEDKRVMALVEITGGKKPASMVKTIDQIEMRNHRRFSWGLERLDEIYDKTRFVHEEDHPDSKYETVQRKLKTRNDKGETVYVNKTSRIWIKGSWQSGDPMIPALEHAMDAKDGFLVTRNEDGTLKTDLPIADQIVEVGCPEAYISIWGGAPGAGKSKLAVKTAKAVIASTQEAILYINGEAEAEQFRMWVGKDTDPDLFTTINAKLLPIQVIQDAATKIKPRLIVIDSVQTLAEWNKGPSGQQSVMHILGAMKVDPTMGRPHIILISQLNKQNDLKGSRDLEHLADTVALVTGTEVEHVSELHIPMKHRCGPTPVGFMFKHGLNDVDFLQDRRSATRQAYDLTVPDGSALESGIDDLPLTSEIEAEQGEGDEGEEGDDGTVLDGDDDAGTDEDA